MGEVPTREGSGYAPVDIIDIAMLLWNLKDIMSSFLETSLKLKGFTFWQEIYNRWKKMLVTFHLTSQEYLTVLELTTTRIGFQPLHGNL